MCVDSYVEASAVSPTSVSHDLILLSAVAEQVSVLFHQIKPSCDFGPKNLNVFEKRRTAAPLMCKPYIISHKKYEYFTQRSP